MSYGGSEAKFMLSLIGQVITVMLCFLCIVFASQISTALGIPESILILLSAAIIIIVTPISLHMGRNGFISVPPSLRFVATGAAIVIAGIVLLLPYFRIENPLGSFLVLLGILQATVGSLVGTRYVKRGYTLPQGDYQSEDPAIAGLMRMAKTMEAFGNVYKHESPTAEERVIEREVLLRQKIPLECDKCGAPINPERLDWIGPDMIKCTSCGTSLRVETERI